jgi:hypothetical protein
VGVGRVLEFSDINICMRKEDWFDYVKVGYELVTEHALLVSVKLDHNTECQIVHIFAKNLRRTDIGTHPIAIQLMEAVQVNDRHALGKVGDECLLIQSFPLRSHRWPSDSYYIDMGTIGYGLAGNSIMERNFVTASKILNSMFQTQL